MAQSRLEKIGTIFSRVSNLIRTGAMHMNERPLWYDVYKAFPPAIAPKFERSVPDIEIKQIFYKEDLIRAKFHKDMGRNLPATNLKDTRYQTLTQKMITLCTNIQKEKGLDLESAYEEAFEVVKSEGFYRQSEDKTSSDLAATFKAALDRKQLDPPINLNIKDVMTDK